MKNRPSWHSASKAEWKEACRREAVIRPLVVERSVSNARADQAAKELGISRSLVYRLVARYRQRAQTSSLLSVPPGRTEQTQWLDKEVETSQDRFIFIEFVGRVSVRGRWMPPESREAAYR